MNSHINTFQKSKKIFILGATGFVGFALTKRLITMGFTDVTCLYRDENKKERLFYEIDTANICFLKGDICQHEVLRKGIEGASIVINTIGRVGNWGKKNKFWAVNVNGPKLIMRIILETDPSIHFIHISTSGVYGYGRGEKDESSPLIKSDEFYTASKIEAHLWLRNQRQKQNSCPVTIFSPSIIWGAGDPIYIPKIIRKLKQRRVFYIGRDVAINFIHIDDVVSYVLIAFFNPNAYNQEYIICGSHPFTWKEYFTKIAEFSNLPPPRIRLPYFLMISLAGFMELITKVINIFRPDFRPFITRLDVMLLAKSVKRNSSKAQRELGYAPQIDFQKGIKGVEVYINKNMEKLGLQ